MALSYDGSGGLFTKLGTIIRASNLFEEQETTNSSGYLFKEMMDLEAKLESANNYDDRARIQFQQLWISAQSMLRNWKRDILDLIPPVLRQALDEAEGFYSSDLQLMLRHLVFCMNRDSETVKQNTVTVGSPSSGTPSPQGNFLVVASKYHPTVEGADDDSQEHGGIWANLYTIICTSNQVPGSELFEVRGNLPRFDASHPKWHNAGLAGITSLITSEGNTLLTNGGFEGSEPDGSITSWETKTGELDTDFKVNSTIPLRGDKALELEMTGTDQKLQQTLSKGTLRPWTKYILTAKVRLGDESDSPTGTLKIGFTGTTGLFASKDVSELDSSYAFLTHVFNTGADPDEITDFIIEMDTSGGTGSVVIDEVTLTPMDIFRGLGIAVIGGSINPAIGDFWTIDVSNDYAGKIQTFFSRWYDILLPGASSPTIDDSLAS